MELRNTPLHLPCKAFLDSEEGKSLQPLIDGALRHLYGFEGSKQAVAGKGKKKQDFIGKKRRNLCYSAVWQRLDNCRLFTALADFYRGLGLLAALGCLELLGYGARLLHLQVTGRTQDHPRARVAGSEPSCPGP